MKITIVLLLITVTTFSGREPTDSTQPLPAVDTVKIEMPNPIQQIDSAKILDTKMAKKTDSLRAAYFEQIKYRNISLDKLIEEKKKGDKENMHLRAEIKELKKTNEFLKQNIDTVYIHDTIFKKRKLIQIFKRKN